MSDRIEFPSVAAAAPDSGAEGPPIRLVSAAARGLRLRPATEGDREVLYRIYASTRLDEVRQTGWDEAQIEAFLRFQFGAQARYYEEQFADASFDLIEQSEERSGEQGGAVIGRLYVDLRDDEIRLIDIALLPQHRGSGLGGALMTDILAEGRRRGLLVRIHVERENPAMRLYRRLGFEKIEEQGVYDLMEWRPDE
ncbi:MAG: GNAT family N-acetyltransferase [Acidobacteriota bacterium]